jgi:hypothetical protein
MHFSALGGRYALSWIAVQRAGGTSQIHLGRHRWIAPSSGINAQCGRRSLQRARSSARHSRQCGGWP